MADNKKNKVGTKKKEPINREKQKYLNPPKPAGCVSSFVERGMSHKQAVKHCNSLWKEEEKIRDEQRTITV